MNMSARELTTIKPFTEEEITSILSMREDELTYDKTLDFLHEVIKASGEKMEGEPPLLKLLLITRHALLSGFEHGIRIYNETLDVAIAKEVARNEYR